MFSLTSARNHPPSLLFSCGILTLTSAGIVGPVSKFFNQLDSPEHASAETLGQALFDNESFEAWENVYRTNTFSIFFTTTALLGLLEKGSKDMESWSSVVINTTSISGLMKLAQDHVRSVLSFPSPSLFFQLSHWIDASSRTTQPKAPHPTSQECSPRNSHSKRFPSASTR